MNYTGFTPRSLLLTSHCLVLGVLLVTLAGCSDHDGNSDSVIRFGISTEPVTLDPRYATDAVSTRINRLIYSRMVEFDEQYRFVPSLTSWERLSSRHYRFQLKKDRNPFHHGRALTAADIKATYESVLTRDTASPHRTSLDMIGRIEVIDDNTVDFHLLRSDTLFPGRLTIGILPADLIRKDHSFNKQPVGSGPLRFSSRADDGNLVLTRIEDDQVIRFVTVRDPTVRVLKLLSGEIDLTQNELPQELIDWLREKESVRIKKVRGDTFTYIGFNLRDPLTGDLRVRQAIAHAINVRPVIRHLFRNTARPARSLLPPEHWAGHDRLNGEGYSPERARKLLKQAGYSADRPLKLTFKTSTNPRSLRIATIFQQQLARVGIELVLSSYDWGTFYGDIKAGKFQMYSLSWVGLKMPDIYRTIFHSDSVPPAGANRGRLDDPDVDHLIEKAENMENMQDKAGVYIQLQERLHDIKTYIPLWYEDNILIMNRRLAGYQPAMDGNYDDLNHIHWSDDSNE